MTVLGGFFTLPCMALHRQQNWLTVFEVAEMFGVTMPTVRNWSRAGYLPVTRTPGGHRRFKREDVDRLMLERGLAPEVPPDE